MERYDCVIVGSGPAGLGAALNLRIRGKSFLLFGSERLSAKLEAAPRIDNYLGFPGVSGKELARVFRAHLDAMDISVRHEQVNMVYPMDGFFSLSTSKNVCEAVTVILAPGAAPARLLPGEERLLGRGVGYCATCDAPLYKGKRVAVLGWSEEAALEANFVSELASELYYVPMRRTVSPLREGIIELSGPAEEIIGRDRVEALKVAGEALPVDGVFVLRESIAPSALVPGVAVKDGFIVVDGGMNTSLPGCFAAGDCTGKPHQLMRASGQGQAAALSAAAYLDSMALKKLRK